MHIPSLRAEMVVMTSPLSANGVFATRDRGAHMLTAIALISSFTIFCLIPVRIHLLRQRGVLNASNFALTAAGGLSLVILVFLYLNLAEVLIVRRDPLLASLGLLTAAMGFAVVYPVTRLGFKYLARYFDSSSARK